MVVRGVAGKTQFATGATIPVDGTLSGVAIRTKTSQISSDWLLDPRTGLTLPVSQVSFLVVPLVYESEVVALLGAHATRLDAFDEQDVELLSMLADVGAKRLAHALTLRSRDELQAQSVAVLEAMTAGLTVLDLNGTIRFANPAALEMFGLTDDEIAGLSNRDQRWQAVHEDGSPWPGELHPSAVTRRTGVAQRDQVIGVHKPQGEVFWVTVNAVPIHNAAGVMTGVACSFDDITERRAADAALHDARAAWKLRSVSPAWPPGRWTWPPARSTGRRRCSRCSVSSRRPTLPLRDCTTRSSKRRTASISRPWPAECIATRKPGTTVVRARWPDGTRRWLWSRMDVATDAAGEVTTLWGNTQDITEREEAAQTLAASEQHFRVAFDNAPIGMTMISLAPGTEGNYLGANAAFCEMLGYTREELVLLTMPDLTHVDDVARDSARFREVAEGDASTIAFDKRFRRKDGETVFAWLTSSVAHGPAGEPLYVITHALDMTTRREQQLELERLALTDTLTGLANRTLLTDRLDQALARLQRVDGSCAVLMLDIDRFKLVNDSLGHQVGDALLVEVAGRIEAVSRADATVARLGGDEFVVLVELTDPDAVHLIAARLLETLRRPYIIDDTTDSLVVTVSIGVSVATTPDRTHVDLFREADLALYRAKDSGRDQYALFDNALRLSVDARLEAESLLRRALATGHVTPFFQPLIDMATGHIRSVESLARIVLPNGDVVTPDAFIDVAEETGLIVELDARMFELGLRQFAAWSAEPDLELQTISTNVSARSLEDSTFVERIRSAMDGSGVEGSSIRVEITERSLLAPSPIVIESLRCIAELGIQVGLDDFGTGYSALAYLQRFDLSFLKIDRSFVGRLGSRRDDAVVATVIALAHALELRVVAEGVETAAQLEALRAMRCDQAQGYLMGRPLPPDELVALIRNRPTW